MAARPLPEDSIAFAEGLADLAGEILRQHFRRPLAVEHKRDLTPVSEADLAVETALRARIAETYPEHGILGEEFDARNPEADFLWVLDPLDGTKRFLTGHAQFGTLIALLHKGVPVIGVIDMPVMDERWVGAAGQPCRHHDRGTARQVRVRPCAEIGEAMLHATSPQMFPGDDFTAFERLRHQTALTLYGGECYAYGLLASGFVDLVAESTMGFYDYLPLVPVVEAAGGRITDWAGAPLSLDSDGTVLAAGDPRCHEQAVALLTRT